MPQLMPLQSREYGWWSLRLKSDCDTLVIWRPMTGTMPHRSPAGHRSRYIGNSATIVPKSCRIHISRHEFSNHLPINLETTLQHFGPFKLKNPNQTPCRRQSWPEISAVLSFSTHLKFPAACKLEQGDLISNTTSWWTTKLQHLSPDWWHSTLQ